MLAFHVKPHGQPVFFIRRETDEAAVRPSEIPVISDMQRGNGAAEIQIRRIAVITAIRMRTERSECVNGYPPSCYPGAEEQQLGRQLVRVLALFPARNIHAPTSFEKIIAKKFLDVKKN